MKLAVQKKSQLHIGLVLSLALLLGACNKDKNENNGGGTASPAAPAPNPNNPNGSERGSNVSTIGGLDHYDNHGKSRTTKIINRQYILNNSSGVSGGQLQWTDHNGAQHTKSAQEMTFVSDSNYIKCVKVRGRIDQAACEQDFWKGFKGRVSCAADTHTNMAMETKFEFDGNGQLSFTAIVNGTPYIAKNIDYKVEHSFLKIRRFVAANAQREPRYIRFSSLASQNKGVSADQEKYYTISAVLNDVTTLDPDNIKSMNDLAAGFVVTMPILMEFRFSDNTSRAQSMAQQNMSNGHPPFPGAQMQPPGGPMPPQGQQAPPIPGMMPMPAPGQQQAQLPTEQVLDKAVIAGTLMLYPVELLGQNAPTQASQTIEKPSNSKETRVEWN